MVKKKSGKAALEKQVARLWLRTVTAGFEGIVVTLFAASFAYYVSSTSEPETVAGNHTGLFFVAGLVLLGFVIVGIAGWMRRNNRDVILLKQRLAQIYSDALENSALNPQLRSSASHD